MTMESAEEKLPEQEQVGQAVAESEKPVEQGNSSNGQEGAGVQESKQVSLPSESAEPQSQEIPSSSNEAVPAASQGAGTSETAERRQNVQPHKVEPPVPDCVNINELHNRPLAELHRLALEAELRVAGMRSKHQLLFELLSYYLKRGTKVEAEGVLEFEKGGYGFLRWIKYSFAPQPDNLYVSQGILKKFNLREGTKLKVTVRGPKDREKFMAVDEVLLLEGIPVEEWKSPKPFDSLTPLFPKDRIILEVPSSTIMTARIVDLIAPLGKGQRGLIVAPPRGGKTLLLKDIAKAIHANYPKIELIVLLLDERPEEVTDFQEAVEVPIFSSTFDEVPKRHIQVAEMVSARAKRLVELGKDVVILLDSLTRLARGYNQVQGGGRIMSGGIGAGALEKPRKFFGAARNVEEGGSLTILATALVETENRMDEVIFEEFKGTGNMEVSLDRELVEKRIFPAIHLSRSGTRNDEKLYHPDEFRRITVLRRELAQTPAVEAIDLLMRNIRNTGSNAELLLKGLK